MPGISRTYTFDDRIALSGSQVESEIQNIVETWNSTDQGLQKWTQLKTSGNLAVDGNAVITGNTTLTGNILANIAMNGFKLTGLGAGTTAGDSLRFEQRHIIQVVSLSTQSATSTTSSTYQATTLTNSITPTSSSNKVLVLAFGTLRSTANAIPALATLFRGATNLGAGGDNYFVKTLLATTTNIDVAASIGYLDAPAITSSTTYTVKISNNDNATTVVWNNGAGQTSLILIEVA